MPDETRKTLCISSQVGCRLACSFCLTGTMGLKSNLTAGEIIGQILAVNVEKVVTIDALTASQGGTLKIKNPAGSFHVHVPKKSPKETVLRIPGKGEVGLFNRVPGDLLLKIRVDTGKTRPPGVVEFFYQVRVIENQLMTPKVRTLITHQGPLRYRLPKNVKAGQAFVLKSKPHPKTGQASHHILVIDLL